MPWSEELDYNELHGPLDGERDLELRGTSMLKNVFNSINGLNYIKWKRRTHTFQHHLLQVWYYDDFKGVV